MSLWKAISNVLSGHRAAAAGCGMLIEQLESRSRDRARIHIPAIVEAMESRIMYSAFNCYMSAKAAGRSPSFINTRAPIPARSP